MSNIRVALRVRPLNEKEREDGSRNIVNVKANAVRIENIKAIGIPDFGDSRTRIREFLFDHCYDCTENAQPFATQTQIFQDLGGDVLSAAFAGFNVCVFAYGQTGTGKTHTMMGEPDDVGLIPRICEGLFSHVTECASENVTCRVDLSYFEIYNERVRDLLQPDLLRQNENYSLKVREHPKDGPYVKDLSWHRVKNNTEIQDLLDQGNELRVTAETYMHGHSSRSHAIVTIMFTQAHLEENQPSEIVSKINLVDLAGSERADPSSRPDFRKRLTEGANINKSLVTLGYVIKALAERSLLSWSPDDAGSFQSSGAGESTSSKPRSSYIPYRDSVLTWLLRDSLGGNSKTIMIATITPASQYYNESINTLRYAQRAKNIINKPRVNEDSNVALIRELRREIVRLHEMLATAKKPPGQFGDIVYFVPSLSGLQGMEYQGGSLISLPESGDSSIAEMLHESEEKANQLTQSWMGKWSSTHDIMKESDLSIRGLRSHTSSRGVMIDSQLPYLIGMDDDVLSTGVVMFHLKEGETQVGKEHDGQEPDIALSGPGILQDHCVIHNRAGDVTLHPFPGASCVVQGIEVTEPTKLNQGDYVVLGGNQVFRFNNPTEAAKLREHRRSQGSLNTLSPPQWSFGGLSRASSFNSLGGDDSSFTSPQSQLMRSYPNYAAPDLCRELEKKHHCEQERINQARADLERLKEEHARAEELRLVKEEEMYQEHEAHHQDIEEQKHRLASLIEENERARARAEEELREARECLAREKEAFQQQLEDERNQLRNQQKHMGESACIQTDPLSTTTTGASTDHALSASAGCGPEEGSHSPIPARKEKSLSPEEQLRSLEEREFLRVMSYRETEQSLALQQEDIEDQYLATQDTIAERRRAIQQKEEEYRQLDKQHLDEIAIQTETVQNLQKQEVQLEVYIQENLELQHVKEAIPQALRSAHSELHLLSPHLEVPAENFAHKTSSLHDIQGEVEKDTSTLQRSASAESLESAHSDILKDTSKEADMEKEENNSAKPKTGKISNVAKNVTSRLYKPPEPKFKYVPKAKEKETRPVTTPRSRTVRNDDARSKVSPARVLKDKEHSPSPQRPLRTKRTSPSPGREVEQKRKPPKTSQNDGDPKSKPKSGAKSKPEPEKSDTVARKPPSPIHHRAVSPKETGKSSPDRLSVVSVGRMVSPKLRHMASASSLASVPEAVGEEKEGDLTYEPYVVRKRNRKGRSSFDDDDMRSHSAPDSQFMAKALDQYTQEMEAQKQQGYVKTPLSTSLSVDESELSKGCDLEMASGEKIVVESLAINEENVMMETNDSLSSKYDNNETLSDNEHNISDGSSTIYQDSVKLGKREHIDSESEQADNNVLLPTKMPKNEDNFSLDGISNIDNVQETQPNAMIEVKRTKSLDDSYSDDSLDSDVSTDSLENGKKKKKKALSQSLPAYLFSQDKPMSDDSLNDSLDDQTMQVQIDNISDDLSMHNGSQGSKADVVVKPSLSKSQTQCHEYLSPESAAEKDSISDTVENQNVNADAALVETYISREDQVGSIDLPVNITPKPSTSVDIGRSKHLDDNIPCSIKIKSSASLAEVADSKNSGESRQLSVSILPNVDIICTDENKEILNQTGECGTTSMETELSTGPTENIHEAGLQGTLPPDMPLICEIVNTERELPPDNKSNEISMETDELLTTDFIENDFEEGLSVAESSQYVTEASNQSGEEKDFKKVGVNTYNTEKEDGTLLNVTENTIDMPENLDNSITEELKQNCSYSIVLPASVVMADIEKETPIQNLDTECDSETRRTNEVVMEIDLPIVSSSDNEMSNQTQKKETDTECLENMAMARKVENGEGKDLAQTSDPSLEIVVECSENMAKAREVLDENGGGKELPQTSDPSQEIVVECSESMAKAREVQGEYGEGNELPKTSDPFQAIVIECSENVATKAREFQDENGEGKKLPKTNDPSLDIVLECSESVATKAMEVQDENGEGKELVQTSDPSQEIVVECSENVAKAREVQGEYGEGNELPKTSDPFQAIVVECSENVSTKAREFQDENGERKELVQTSDPSQKLVLINSENMAKAKEVQDENVEGKELAQTSDPSQDIVLEFSENGAKAREIQDENVDGKELAQTSDPSQDIVLECSENVAKASEVQDENVEGKELAQTSDPSQDIVLENSENVAKASEVQDEKDTHEENDALPQVNDPPQQITSACSENVLSGKEQDEKCINSENNDLPKIKQDTYDRHGTEIEMNYPSQQIAPVHSENVVFPNEVQDVCILLEENNDMPQIDHSSQEIQSLFSENVAVARKVQDENEKQNEEKEFPQMNNLSPDTAPSCSENVDTLKEIKNDIDLQQDNELPQISNPSEEIPSECLENVNIVGEVLVESDKETVEYQMSDISQEYVPVSSENVATTKEMGDDVSLQKENELPQINNPAQELPFGCLESVTIAKNGHNENDIINKGNEAHQMRKVSQDIAPEHYESIANVEEMEKEDGLQPNNELPQIRNAAQEITSEYLENVNIVREVHNETDIHSEENKLHQMSIVSQDIDPVCPEGEAITKKVNGDIDLQKDYVLPHVSNAAQEIPSECSENVTMPREVQDDKHTKEIELPQRNNLSQDITLAGSGNEAITKVIQDGNCLQEENELPQVSNPTQEIIPEGTVNEAIARDIQDEGKIHVEDDQRKHIQGYVNDVIGSAQDRLQHENKVLAGIFTDGTDSGFETSDHRDTRQAGVCDSDSETSMTDDSITQTDLKVNENVSELVGETEGTHTSNDGMQVGNIEANDTEPHLVSDAALQNNIVALNTATEIVNDIKLEKENEHRDAVNVDGEHIVHTSKAENMHEKPMNTENTDYTKLKPQPEQQISEENTDFAPESEEKPAEMSVDMNVEVIIDPDMPEVTAEPFKSSQVSLTNNNDNKTTLKNMTVKEECPDAETIDKIEGSVAPVQTRSLGVCTRLDFPECHGDDFDDFSQCSNDSFLDPNEELQILQEVLDQIPKSSTSGPQLSTARRAARQRAMLRQQQRGDDSDGVGQFSDDSPATGNSAKSSSRPGSGTRRRKPRTNKSIDKASRSKSHTSDDYDSSEDDSVYSDDSLGHVKEEHHRQNGVERLDARDGDMISVSSIEGDAEEMLARQKLGHQGSARPKHVKHSEFPDVEGPDGKRSVGIQTLDNTRRHRSYGDGSVRADLSDFDNSFASGDHGRVNMVTSPLIVWNSNDKSESDSQSDRNSTSSAGVVKHMSDLERSMAPTPGSGDKSNTSIFSYRSNLDRGPTEVWSSSSSELRRLQDFNEDLSYIMETEVMSPGASSLDFSEDAHSQYSSSCLQTPREWEKVTYRPECSTPNTSSRVVDVTYPESQIERAANLDMSAPVLFEVTVHEAHTNIEYNVERSEYKTYALRNERSDEARVIPDTIHVNLTESVSSQTHDIAERHHVEEMFMGNSNEDESGDKIVLEKLNKSSYSAEKETVHQNGKIKDEHQKEFKEETETKSSKYVPSGNARDKECKKKHIKLGNSGVIGSTNYPSAEITNNSGIMQPEDEGAASAKCEDPILLDESDYTSDYGTITSIDGRKGFMSFTSDSEENDSMLVGSPGISPRASHVSRTLGEEANPPAFLAVQDSLLETPQLKASDIPTQGENICSVEDVVSPLVARTSQASPVNLVSNTSLSETSNQPDERLSNVEPVDKVDDDTETDSSSVSTVKVQDDDQKTSNFCSQETLDEIIDTFENKKPADEESAATDSITQTDENKSSANTSTDDIYPSLGNTSSSSSNYRTPQQSPRDINGDDDEMSNQIMDVQIPDLSAEYKQPSLTKVADENPEADSPISTSSPKRPGSVRTVSVNTDSVNVEANSHPLTKIPQFLEDQNTETVRKTLEKKIEKLQHKCRSLSDSAISSDYTDGDSASLSPRAIKFGESSRQYGRCDDVSNHGPFPVFRASQSPSKLEKRLDFEGSSVNKSPFKDSGNVFDGEDEASCSNDQLASQPRKKRVVSRQDIPLPEEITNFPQSIVASTLAIKPFPIKRSASLDSLSAKINVGTHLSRAVRSMSSSKDIDKVENGKGSNKSLPKSKQRVSFDANQNIVQNSDSEENEIDSSNLSEAAGLGDSQSGRCLSPGEIGITQQSIEDMYNTVENEDIIPAVDMPLHTTNKISEKSTSMSFLDNERPNRAYLRSFSEGNIDDYEEENAVSSNSNDSITFVFMGKYCDQDNLDKGLVDQDPETVNISGRGLPSYSSSDLADNEQVISRSASNESVQSENDVVMSRSNSEGSIKLSTGFGTLENKTTDDQESTHSASEEIEEIIKSKEQSDGLMAYRDTGNSYTSPSPLSATDTSFGLVQQRRRYPCDEDDDSAPLRHKFGIDESVLPIAERSISADNLPKLVSAMKNIHRSRSASMIDVGIMDNQESESGIFPPALSYVDEDITEASASLRTTSEGRNELISARTPSEALGSYSNRTSAELITESSSSQDVSSAMVRSVQSTSSLSSSVEEFQEEFVIEYKSNKKKQKQQKKPESWSYSSEGEIDPEHFEEEQQIREVLETVQKFIMPQPVLVDRGMSTENESASLPVSRGVQTSDDESSAQPDNRRTAVLRPDQILLPALAAPFRAQSMDSFGLGAAGQEHELSDDTRNWCTLGELMAETTQLLRRINEKLPDLDRSSVCSSEESQAIIQQWQEISIQTGCSLNNVSTVGLQTDEDSCQSEMKPTMCSESTQIDKVFKIKPLSSSDICTEEVLPVPLDCSPCETSVQTDEDVIPDAALNTIQPEASDNSAVSNLEDDEENMLPSEAAGTENGGKPGSTTVEAEQDSPPVKQKHFTEKNNAKFIPQVKAQLGLDQPTSEESVITPAQASNTQAHFSQTLPGLLLPDSKEIEELRQEHALLMENLKKASEDRKARKADIVSRKQMHEISEATAERRETQNEEPAPEVDDIEQNCKHSDSNSEEPTQSPLQSPNEIVQINIQVDPNEGVKIENRTYKENSEEVGDVKKPKPLKPKEPGLTHELSWKMTADELTAVADERPESRSGHSRSASSSSTLSNDTAVCTDEPNGTSNFVTNIDHPPKEPENQPDQVKETLQNDVMGMPLEEVIVPEIFKRQNRLPDLNHPQTESDTNTKAEVTDDIDHEERGPDAAKTIIKSETSPKLNSQPRRPQNNLSDENSPGLDSSVFDDNVDSKEIPNEPSPIVSMKPQQNGVSREPPKFGHSDDATQVSIDFSDCCTQTDNEESPNEPVQPVQEEIFKPEKSEQAEAPKENDDKQPDESQPKNLSDELGELQKERVHILDLLSMTYLPSSLTVELLEAKLNYCIGQTDLLLDNIEDNFTPEDKQRPLTQEQQNVRDYISKYRSDLKKSKQDILECQERLKRGPGVGRGRTPTRKRDMLNKQRLAQVEAFKLERMREQSDYARSRHGTPLKGNTPLIGNSPVITPRSERSRSSSPNYSPGYMTPREHQAHLLDLRRQFIRDVAEEETRHSRSCSPNLQHYHRSPAKRNKSPGESSLGFSPKVTMSTPEDLNQSGEEMTSFEVPPSSVSPVRSGLGSYGSPDLDRKTFAESVFTPQESEQILREIEEIQRQRPNMSAPVEDMLRRASFSSSSSYRSSSSRPDLSPRPYTDQRVPRNRSSSPVPKYQDPLALNLASLHDDERSYSPYSAYAREHIIPNERPQDGGVLRGSYELYSTGAHDRSDSSSLLSCSSDTGSATGRPPLDEDTVKRLRPINATDIKSRLGRHKR